MIARGSSPSRSVCPSVRKTPPGPGSMYCGHGPNLEMQAQKMSKAPSASTVGRRRCGLLVASVSIAIDRLVLARFVELALEPRRQLHPFGLVDVTWLRQPRRQIHVARHARRTRAQHDDARAEPHRLG